ncbi:hypothetical protein Bca101_054228 [Brassica carinata]
MASLLGIVFPVVTFTGHGQLPAKLHSRRRLVVKSSSSSDERQILFNRIAPVYDNLNDLLSLGQHRIWKNMAVSWSGARTGDKVLDLCCGSGDLAFLLSEKVGPSGKVTGLDFSSEQLAVAASRQKLRGRSCYKCIEWIEGDATDLPFDDCEFDAITMGYGLRNVVDRDRAMREMYRVLKPGEELETLASEAGFSSARHYEISGGFMGNLVAVR